jgi:signal transduction histidine kinase
MENHFYYSKKYIQKPERYSKLKKRRLGEMTVSFFWIRFVIFSLISVVFLYQEFEPTQHFAVLLLLFSLLLIGYFLLSVVPKPAVLHGVMGILLFSFGFFASSETKVYILFLFLYLMMEGAVLLSSKDFLYSFGSYLILSFLFLYWKVPEKSPFLLVSSLFAILTFSLNRSFAALKEKQKLYETLVGEFRKLKRISYESERTARLEERTRIARDIHDSVGHKLTALLMHLQILSMQKGEDFEELKGLVQDSLEETRQAVRALRTEEHEGIATVLELIRKLEAESHIFLNLTIKKGILSTPLTNQESIVLYRVIQEALTNAMRHSHSKEVELQLGFDAIGKLEFSISNKVVEKKEFTFGFGLSNMEERLKEIGGKLTVYYTETDFVVEGSFPLKGENRNVESIIG